MCDSFSMSIAHHITAQVWHITGVASLDTEQANDAQFLYTAWWTTGPSKMFADSPIIPGCCCPLSLFKCCDRSMFHTLPLPCCCRCRRCHAIAVPEQALPAQVPGPLADHTGHCLHRPHLATSTGREGGRQGEVATRTSQTLHQSHTCVHIAGGSCLAHWPPAHDVIGGKAVVPACLSSPSSALSKYYFHILL